ncbi:hypothetical protein LTS15_009099 [Exophiala xenobiotica]|nr:hypothetical protein LTS15_009099 [Exophiala xenobiotica]
MTSDDRLDVLYAKCFGDQPEGHFLYRPASSGRLKSGVCGFFDHQGDWQVVADLTSPEDLEKEGYSSVSGIEVDEADIGGAEWGLRMSWNIQRVYHGKDENPSQRTDGDFEAEFKSSSGLGAILVTDGAVKLTRARPAQKLSQWLHQNARAVVANNPDVRSRGLWLVINSYSVKRSAVAVIDSKMKDKSLVISLTGLNTGQVQPTTAWWQSDSASAWTKRHDDKGIVCAMGGIHWTQRSFLLSSLMRSDNVLHKMGRENEKAVISPVNLELGEDESTDQATVGLVPEVRGHVYDVQVDSDNIQLIQNPDDSNEEEYECDDDDDEEDIEESDRRSTSALDEDPSEPASRPQTMVGRSQNMSVHYSRSRRRELGKGGAATMFAQRRHFSRQLAESCRLVQENSPAAIWHEWAADRVWPLELRSVSVILEARSAAIDMTEYSLVLKEMMRYVEQLRENWLTFPSNGGEDVSATALVYQSYRNVVSVLEVNQKQTVSLHTLITTAYSAIASNEDQALLFQMYQDSTFSISPSKQEVQTGTGLVSIVEPWNGESEDLIRYLQTMLQAIDLVMVSHLNAHRSTADRESSGNLIRIPAQADDTMGSENVLLFRPYRLACLDGLTRGRKVWVFHRQSELPKEPLYLSARPDHFAMIWGPLWAVPADGMDSLIDHYNVGGGQLYPVERRDGPQLVQNERRCHWKKQAPDDEPEDANSLSGKDSEPDRSSPVHSQQMREAEPLEDGTTLLIGATANESPRMKWYACHCSMSDLKSSMRGSQHLHPLSSRGWFKYVSSTTAGLNLSYSGVGLSGTASIQTDEGQTRKQGWLETWENCPRSWDPRDLMDFGGVLISACTFNARRVRLVELLKTDTMLSVIDRCWFDHEDTRQTLIDTLEDENPFAIVDLWERNKRNPTARDDLGNALLACIRALCKSGWDDRHKVFNVLWKPPHERKTYRLELQVSEHPWLDLLKDTEDSMTVAVLVEDRLATCSRSPCGRDSTPTTLETAIVINSSLSPVQHLRKVKRRRYRDPSPWRSADRRWKYVWKVRDIPDGESLRLAGTNSLKIISPLSDKHLLVKQTPVLLQRLRDNWRARPSRRECHWEYASDNSDDDSAGDDVRPVPVRVR